MREAPWPGRLGSPGPLVRFLCTGFIAPLVLAAACSKPPPSKLDVEITTLVRRHQELLLRPNSPPLPRYLGHDNPLSLCVETDATTDTSQWVARLQLDGKALTEGFEAPSVGLGNVLCFDSPVPESVGGARVARFGGELRDRFDASQLPLPEREIYLEADDAPYKALRREIVEATQDPDQSPRELADRLLFFRDRATREGFPRLSIRAALMAVYFLRSEGSEESYALARQVLADLPPWLEDDAASYRASQVALTRADMALAEQWDLNQAWVFLGEAENRQARIADPNRIETVRIQSEILARVDAASEGVARLRSAIEDCGRWPCNPVLLLGARVTLGWLTLLDPQADEKDFEVAREISESALAEIPAEDFPEERANLLVNLAHLSLLLGDDPEPLLLRAQELLDTTRDNARQEVRGWIQIVRGSAALAAKRPRLALQICVDLAQEARAPLVAAWAWGCAARALRQVGDLTLAAEAFDEALRLHAYATPERLGQSIASGLSRRSEDYYGAARLAVDRGDLQGAWDLLALLDRLSSRGARSAACTPGAARASTTRSREREALLEDLEALERPAAEARRIQRKALRQSIRQRLQELWRQQGVCGATEEHLFEEPDFRAFLVEGDLILLEGRPVGGPRLARRSEVSAKDLRLRLRQIVRASPTSPLSDGQWRSLLEPFSQALIPPKLESLGAVTSFALHGILQDVPLGALPLDGFQEGPEAWLSSVTIPVHRPAQGGLSPVAIPGEVPLFVVDPLGDLLSGEMVSEYRRLFPQSRILSGPAARRDAFRRDLEGARWLHVDAHGNFDPAFPELSSLRMADRPMTFIELAELPISLQFANLSSCLTGRWPITADSGHYGIAGLMVRRGVPWVIGSRVELGNRFAGDFNRSFYRALKENDDPVEAFGQALALARAQYPASTWGALALLGRQRKGGASSANPHSPNDEGRSPQTDETETTSPRGSRAGETQ